MANDFFSHSFLERRQKFSMYGGVRLGSTLSVEDAFSLGFNHIALATGAGSPRIPLVKNMLVKGVMTASSFLMALHLGNAHHNNSISDLQIRLPAVVLGGGLTAVDTATEVLAYYPVQVEKLSLRCKTLEKKYGQSIPQNCNFSSRNAKCVSYSIGEQNCIWMYEVLHCHNQETVPHQRITHG